MKKNFEEPKMDVVHFNAQDVVTAVSGVCTKDNTMPIGPCLEGCTGPKDAIIGS